MLENLLELERDWFFAINGSHTWWLDKIMFFFASPWVWSPPIIVVLFFFFKRQNDKMLMLIFTILIAATTIVVAEYLIKPYFSRFRPTSHPLFLDDVRIYCNYIADGAYGFISSHSANAFAFATMSAFVVKKCWYSFAIIFWAFVMVYSRVYLGAHFITDVIPGMIVGIFTGWVFYLLYKFMLIKWKII